MFKKYFALLTSIFLLFSVVGCSSGESPETAVTNYLNACKSMDRETIAKYTDGYAEDASDSAETAVDDLGEEAAKMLMDGLTYEILSSEENDGTATVKVSITNMDMSAVMSDAITQMFSLIFSDITEEEMDEKTTEIFLSAMENNKDTTVTKEIDISLTKGEDIWLITPSDDLVDAITGGILSFADSFNESFSE